MTVCRVKQLSLFVTFVVSLVSAAALMSQTDEALPWQSVITGDGSAVTARHESGVVAVNGKLYALGGRATRPLESYNPATGEWTNLGPMPMELHHFQPVAIGDVIYVTGAFTCCYPEELTVADVYTYHTVTGVWSVAGQMPADRVRGSTATFTYQDQIYLLGGNTKGHSGGAVAWFDRFDPISGDWSVLPDAPNARDHFGAFVLNDRVVAAAGRQTDQPNPFRNPVAATDVFDFYTNSWQSMDDIPTVRAGALVGGAGDEIVVAGGEIFSTSTSLDVVEAFNVYTGQWRTLQAMLLGRHSGGGAMLGNEFHVLAGSLNTGGAPETDTHEMLLLDETKNNDVDSDGLSNDEEKQLYLTNPLASDTDGDGLEDLAEVQTHQSDPNRIDSDDDGLDDGAEVLAGLSPINSDTDNDGIADAEDLEPLVADVQATSNDSGGGAMFWLLCAFVVGSLSRGQKSCVKKSTI